jgi:DNA mismatch endonuclease (patch repair protein)
MQLRRLLHRAGRRFSKNVRSLPGCPDIVFTSAKVVVFCDGDFWHGSDWTERRTKLQKGSNSGYWISKIERNMARDIQNQLLLESRGWHVLRFWESEVLANGLAVVADIEDVLDRGE